jgi:hydroxymethylpyrimidine kinase/phosphomethylpyrimidine kinase
MHEAGKNHSHQVFVFAGHDPTGNAGILRDIEVCKFHDTDYQAMPTAFTRQTDSRYFGAAHPSRRYYRKSLKRVKIDNIHSIKIGMLGKKRAVDFIIELIHNARKINPDLKVVWDPVFTSSSGGKLISRWAKRRALKNLLPLIDLLTPNAIEACHLLGIVYRQDLNQQELCEALYKKYQTAIILKGGHLNQKATDMYYDGNTLKTMPAPISFKKLRGTGCAFSTTIACHLANGDSLLDACLAGKEFMNRLFLESIKL